mmetsp:Transcript_14190/g.40226  ORF Transcript_14190/g.40226 Transcript_14190/m.40226 type:complete len:388 (-) Transcript_14190:270-1433(-)
MSRASFSNQVRDVHWHLVDLRAVVLLDVLERVQVVVLDEVDGHALLPEPPRTADPVDVELPVHRQVVVDHQGHLLHVQPSCPNIRSNENPRRPAPKIRHDQVPLLLRHVSVHGRNREVVRPHLLSEPLDLLPLVAKYDGLSDGQRVVQVAQRIKLPFLPLNSNEELLDSLEGQLVPLHQNPQRIRHELLRHLQDVLGQGGRHQDDLRLRRKVAINVEDLLLETSVKHLVRLVQDQELDLPGPQGPSLDHVKKPSGGSTHDVNAVIKFSDVFADRFASDTAVRLNVHEVSDSKDNLIRLGRQLSRGRNDKSLHLPSLRVDILTDGQGYHRSLSCTTLSLCNHVSPFDDRNNSTLLYRRRLVEAILVYATKEVLTEAHLVEGVDDRHTL